MAALCFSSEFLSGDRKSAVDELLVGLENGCRLARGYRDARGAGEDILTDGTEAQVWVCVCSDPGRILNADSRFDIRDDLL